MGKMSEDDAFYFALGIAAGAALYWIVVRVVLRTNTRKL